MDKRKNINVLLIVLVVIVSFSACSKDTTRAAIQKDVEGVTSQKKVIDYGMTFGTSPERISALCYENLSLKNGEIVLATSKEECINRGFSEDEYERLKQSLPILNEREENIRQWILSGTALPRGWRLFQEDQEEYFARKKELSQQTE